MRINLKQMFWGLVAAVLVLPAFLPIKQVLPAAADSRAIYQGPDKNQVALMCNVAWGAEYLPTIMNAAESYGAKLTFFWEGRYAEKNPEMVRALQAAGHEIANHGDKHRDHSALDLSGNLMEIDRAGKKLEAITGTYPPLFAPPSGAYNTATLDAAESLGLKTILWTLDTVDWKHPGPDAIYDKLTEKMEPGAFILMHPTIDSAEMLPRLLRWLYDNGYAAVTVSELLTGE